MTTGIVALAWVSPSSPRATLRWATAIGCIGSSATQAMRGSLGDSDGVVVCLALLAAGMGFIALAGRGPLRLARLPNAS